MKWLAFALVFAACDANDPCEGKRRVCIAVKATGAVRVDSIAVTATLPSGTRLHGRTIEAVEEFALPVQFALLLPEAAIGLVGVELVGSSDGDSRASGAGQVTVPDAGKARLTVALAPFDADLGAPDLAVPPLPDFAVAIDQAEPSPTLSPTSLDFGPVLAGSSRTAQLIFKNPRARDVVVSDVELVPPGPPFGFATTGSCKPNESVGPMQSCTIDLTFSPAMRQTVFAQVKVVFGAAGEVAATVGGRGVAWLAESLETPDGSTAPNLFTVWGASLDDVWVGGDASSLFRNRNAGWSKLTTPDSVPTVSTIWGTSSTDVYLVSKDAKKIFHLGGSMGWVGDGLSTAGTPIAIFGLSSSDVFAATNAGEIVRGTAGNWSPDPRTANGALYALWGTSAENLYATGNEIAHRTVNGWSTLTVPAPSGGHFSVWGSGPNDVYVVGWDLSPGDCCGFIKHSAGAQFSTETLANSVNALRGVWGSADDDVFAVGKNGLVLRKGAGGWVAEASGTTADLYGVWGAGGEVFAVGDAGTILHRH